LPRGFPRVRIPEVAPPFKPPGLRQRRNRTSTAATFEAGAAAKVDLDKLDPNRPWHKLTRWSWDIWWASPMAVEWVDADVPGLVRIARLVDDFWHAETDVAAKLEGQIRLSSTQYGISPISRRQLQWEIKRVEAVAAKPAATTRPRDPRLRAVG
jgi:hypothetical protein